MRTPDTVRTLGLRTTDIKAISATLNQAIAPIIQRTTQRGFIAGRLFTSNILELGMMARVASLQPAVLERNPLLVALDFGQAF
eukprot:9325276-Pyramimonas_sp.AAC.1